MEILGQGTVGSMVFVLFRALPYGCARSLDRENGLAGVRRFKLTARYVIRLLIREFVRRLGTGILVVAHLWLSFLSPRYVRLRHAPTKFHRPLCAPRLRLARNGVDEIGAAGEAGNHPLTRPAAFNAPASLNSSSSSRGPYRQGFRPPYTPGGPFIG